MPALFAVLISGVLLNPMDAPLPKSHLVFTSSTGKLIEVTTDKDGRFQVDLVAPGTYKVQIGYGQFKRGQFITVDSNTSTLKLKFPEPRVIDTPGPNQPLFVGDVLPPNQ